MSAAPAKSSRRWMIAAAAAMVLTCAVVLAWVSRSPAIPPADGDPVQIARFVRTDAYERLPEADKRPYMKALRKNLDRVATAHRAGQLTRKEYEEAYLNTWMERRLDQMEDFYKVPAAQRQQRLIAEYVKKNKSSLSSSRPSAAAELPKPDDATEENFEDDRVATWPPEEQAKWQQYRQAVKKAKDAAKSQAG
jgi:hypothetical protein